MTRPTLAAIATLLLALPATAAPKLPLLGPGRIVGSMHEVHLPRGMTIDDLASRYGIHPIRITRPSWAVLKDGLQRGEKLTVDQRRVEPTFAPDLQGLVLNIPEAHLYRVENSRLVRDYPVGVSRSDWQAPIGMTRIVAMEKNPVWVVPKSIQDEMEKNGQDVIEKMEAGPDNPLGSRWIGFGNGRFGFHGTTVPTSIKRYASHGCVRMLAPHLQDLYTRVRVGMPVYVYYQPVLLAVDAHGIWLSAYPDIYDRKPDRLGLVRSLAEQAGVRHRVNWKTVANVLKLSNGMVVNVATAGGPLLPQPSGTPKPAAKPSLRPTATPQVTATPSLGPTAPATVVPSHAPTVMPSPTATPGQPPTAVPTVAPKVSPVEPRPAAVEPERPL
jgi:L,D-transpeptidase ErfK/SrfK